MKGFLTELRHWTVFSFFIFLPMATIAQVPFGKGVNLTNWFQTNSARQIQFSKYTRNDFQHIKSLGCDVIRLPINLHSMTSGAPDYTLDPLFLTFLDQAVGWAEELQLNLILDNHSFDPAAITDPTIGSVLTKVWTQMAHHFKDRSKYIFYEVLNEPHGIDDAVWAPIQQSVIDAIRTEDVKHFIVVGAANWNSYSNLSNLPVYTDNKLIYTFHFYDPFVFTHQGASWADPSMVPLAGVPFPYKASAMPAVPAELKGTWIEGALNDYSNIGTVNKIKELIDIAVAFKTQRNVPVYCGEFGVYIPNSNNTDRVAWYQAVSSYLNEKGIPWTTWDYQGGFGLFKKDSNELFDYDINVPLLQALGLPVPAQLPYQKKPKTTGFILYDDTIGENISEYSPSGTGILDYYSDKAPHDGSYCIYWTGVGQYDQIGFDFKPDLDMSLLKDQDTLQFWVRGDSPAAKFDMRFIDTKTDANDHPWRMGKTIDKTFAAWDGNWHHIRIPLKNLEEKGSYDNAWFDPQGKFDWSAVDRFEIVPEQQPLDGIQFSFDNIQVSGKDIVIIAGFPEASNPFGLIAYPNPFVDHAMIEYQLQNSGSVNLGIYSVHGQRVKTLVQAMEFKGPHTIQWEGKDDRGQNLPKGLYIVRLESTAGSSSLKLMVGI